MMVKAFILHCSWNLAPCATSLCLGSTLISIQQVAGSSKQVEVLNGKCTVKHDNGCLRRWSLWLNRICAGSLSGSFKNTNHKYYLRHCILPKVRELSSCHVQTADDSESHQHIIFLSRIIRSTTTDTYGPQNKWLDIFKKMNGQLWSILNPNI